MSKPKYRLSLLTNSTIVNPGAKVVFTVKVTPPISGEASIERLVLGVWAKIGTVNVGADGVGRLTFTMPEEPGTYRFKATMIINGVKYESSVLNVIVRGPSKTTPTPPAQLLPPETLLAIVVTVAGVSFLLWWRRRR